MQQKKRQTPSTLAKIAGELKARVIALACGEDPEAYARWTLRLLTPKHGSWLNIAETELAAMELEEADHAEDAVEKEKSEEEIGRIVKELQERKALYQGYAEELKETRETQKSLTDGDSRLMRANGKMEVCYNVQTAVDAKRKLIAEYEVTKD